MFNLTVDEAHEYFANGILVGNSDALGYMVHRIRPLRYHQETVGGRISVAVR